MRQLLMVSEGDKLSKITIPDTAVLTFGPFSPPPKNKNWDSDAKRGTLRVYTDETKKNIIACFAHVASFRDLGQIGYSEQIVKEEGASIWKDDEKGYVREQSMKAEKQWVADEAHMLEPKKQRIRRAN